MILPFISIEALAVASYEQEPAGVDRESYLLGFAAGVEALNRTLRERLETQVRIPAPTSDRE